MSILAGILGGAGLVTGLLGQNSSNNAQKEIQREQNAFNLDMWNKQNAYNDPSAVMSRLKAAGLNPNLVYGNGSSTMQAASPQAAAGRDYKSPLSSLSGQLNNSTGTMLQARLNDAQIKSLETRSELTQTQSSAAKLNMSLTTLKKIYQEGLNKKLSETTPLLLDNIRAQTMKMLQDTDLSSAKTSSIDIDNSTRSAMNSLRLSHMQNLVNLTAARGEEIYNSIRLANESSALKTKLTFAQIQHLVAGVRQLQSGASYNDVKSELTKKGIDAYDVDKVYNRASTIIGGVSNVAGMVSKMR